MLSKAQVVFLISSTLSALVVYKVHEYQKEERSVKIESKIYIYSIVLKIKSPNTILAC